MIRSMTGHGQALIENAQVRVLAEIRSVNNRFLKIHIHSDLDYRHQSKAETLIKQHCNRGSVNLKIKVQKVDSGGDFRLNESVIRSYWLQLSEIAGSSQSINVESILQLPGVMLEDFDGDETDSQWPAIEQAITEAIGKLTHMRSLEGDAMQQDLISNCQSIASDLEKIRELAPAVIENYATKVTARINGLLEKHNVAIQPADIVKEVGVFAERVDIAEETVRLESHLGQFHSILNADQSNGRKLDFLVQEMLRETNTIGSKANDSEIATYVVSIKTSIERIREMVQNVE